MSTLHKRTSSPTDAEWMQETDSVWKLVVDLLDYGSNGKPQAILISLDVFVLLVPFYLRLWTLAFAVTCIGQIVPRQSRGRGPREFIIMQHLLSCNSFDDAAAVAATQIYECVRRGVAELKIPISSFLSSFALLAAQKLRGIFLDAFRDCGVVCETFAHQQMSYSWILLKVSERRWKKATAWSPP